MPVASGPAILSVPPRPAIYARSSPSCTWTRISSPVDTQQPFGLHGVSGTGPSDVWAAGGGGPLTGTPIIEHSDGKGWTVTPSPQQFTAAELDSVSALAPNDAWAVGWYGKYSSKPPLFFPIIEHWNGAKWTVVASPASLVYLALHSVKALAPNDVWASGSAGSGGSYNPVIIHWDGHSWSVSKRSDVLGSSPSISGSAPDDVWSVADYYSGAGGGFFEHWNGSAWSQVRDPSNDAAGVAATAANDVWAVGNSKAGPTSEHWDGSTWTPQSVPLPGGAGSPALSAIVAESSGLAVAVGSYAPSGHRFGPWMIAWNGSSWKRVPIGVAQQSYFEGIGAIPSGGELWAVGTYLNARMQSWQGMTYHAVCAS